MKPITVDMEDVEKIAFAASVIKQIESALSAYKQDPFIRPHLQFTDALERLLSVVRSEQRKTAGTLVDWDGELDEKEFKYLNDLVTLFEENEVPFDIISPDFRLKHKEVDRLAAKGCIVLGQLVRGVIWAGESKPELVVDSKGFAVKITERGRMKLRK